MKTYSDDIPCRVLAVRLVVLLWWIGLLKTLQFQLRGQEGTKIWNWTRPRCDHWQHTSESSHAESCCVQILMQIYKIGLTWEGGDVIFEKALSFSRLCHESCEGSLYISSLTCCLLPQHLIVRHRFSKSLEKHTSCNIPALWDFFLHGNEKQFWLTGVLM